MRFCDNGNQTLPSIQEFTIVRTIVGFGRERTNTISGLSCPNSKSSPVVVIFTTSSRVFLSQEGDFVGI